MHILNKIVKAKLKEVDLKKSLVPLKQLEASELFRRPLNSLSQQLAKSKSGVIAEYKRRSPSKPLINTSLSVEEVAKGYTQAGVCGISVLTDGQFFGGSLDDLLLARASTSVPLLRKEFIIDEYQLIEAKAYGADVVLLIAAILDENDIKNLAQKARDLDLEVLLEVHNEEELKKSLNVEVEMIGINNRNLKTFEVSIESSIALAKHIPDHIIKISESGIDSVDAINGLRTHGFMGFLIGENFMRSDDPGNSARQFIKELEK